MIKFELPDGDASALYHIGVALQNIASELRPELRQHQIIERTHTVGDVSVTEKFAETDTVSEQYASLAKDGVVKREGPFYWSHPESDSYGMVDTEEELIEAVTPEFAHEITEDMYNALSDAHGDNPPPIADDTPPPPPVDNVVEQVESADAPVTGVETDINGLPWDKRIHSANRTKNADGSWRNARQPKAFEGDWAEQIKSIEAELRGAMSDDTPPPVDTPVDDTPPPPVEEPTPFDQAVTQDVPPPPVDAATGEPKTFPELMKLITENAKNGSVAKVQEIIKAHNYGSLQTLNSVGPQAVTTVYHELKGQL